MTSRKSKKQIIVTTVILFIVGNISLVFEISSVEESYGRRKLIISGNMYQNVSIFQHYPLDVDLANVVNEAILHNTNIPYKPINPYSYKCIHTPVPCDFKRAENESNSILIVVKSHVLNTNQRLAIRHVWKNARDKRVRLVFLLGTYSLEGEQWRIEKEVKLYHDIVQGNFVDSFDHITYKIVMAFNWIDRHCTQADFLLFVDDDFYVYPTAMLTFLRQLPNQQDTFIGKVIQKQFVKHN
ncbi:UDP-GlcNAc:betaGal beta-1,3-N-acetylglucosaminyltransferase 7 [Mizuhopecten yessoensis]|uniref:Hexosyltransferase n=1 Tax=Mizuhopecten yessoensis TaxID=6573 RepID=A0A210QK13_MIZYE|nr:UDP-GlcNAc:betaGal beta-1,3-N-acetylglucosaminyltransferase 7 [Mizuhopecten yessoensis]